MRLFVLYPLLITTLVVSGCATSKKVQPVQLGDQNLSCAALLSEKKKLDRAQAKVDAKKGITGVNVASFLFWLPGLAYTYYDASQATTAILDRKSHITQIYDKKCS